ncbi:MAG: polymer-forming cytoskeletal protein [Burkholderiaceae bacterium]|nr:MAG: polymer-forming cytoskeletal protein [Burkholderiaceae bacterium]
MSLFSAASKHKQRTIECLIGATTIIQGDIHFQGGLRIDGVVKGNVIAEPGAPSMLVLTEHARIEGEVHAAHLIVNGTLVGPVQAYELLELQPKARVEGDVIYKALEMHHGAVVSGRLVYSDGDAERPSLKLLPGTAAAPAAEVANGA